MWRVYSLFRLPSLPRQPPRPAISPLPRYRSSSHPRVLPPSSVPLFLSLFFSFPSSLPRVSAADAVIVRCSSRCIVVRNNDFIKIHARGHDDTIGRERERVNSRAGRTGRTRASWKTGGTCERFFFLFSSFFLFFLFFFSLRARFFARGSGAFLFFLFPPPAALPPHSPLPSAGTKNRAVCRFGTSRFCRARCLRRRGGSPGEFFLSLFLSRSLARCALIGSRGARGVARAREFSYSRFH